MANTKAKSKTSKKKNSADSPPPDRNIGKSAKSLPQGIEPLASIATFASLAAQSILTNGQCDNIASDCVRKITQSGREYSRSDQLQQYGVNSDQQCRAIVDVIIGNKDAGVARYSFKIADTSKLSGVSSGWTMAQLADTVQSSAIPSK
jgi:hypothetical protein